MDKETTSRAEKKCFASWTSDSNTHFNIAQRQTLYNCDLKHKLNGSTEAKRRERKEQKRNYRMSCEINGRKFYLHVKNNDAVYYVNIKTTTTRAANKRSRNFGANWKSVSSNATTSMAVCRDDASDRTQQNKNWAKLTFRASTNRFVSWKCEQKQQNKSSAVRRWHRQNEKRKATVQRSKIFFDFFFFLCKYARWLKQIRENSDTNTANINKRTMKIRRVRAQPRKHSFSFTAFWCFFSVVHSHQINLVQISFFTPFLFFCWAASFALSSHSCQF